MVYDYNYYYGYELGQSKEAGSSLCILLLLSYCVKLLLMLIIQSHMCRKCIEDVEFQLCLHYVMSEYVSRSLQPRGFFATELCCHSGRDPLC